MGGGGYPLDAAAFSSVRRQSDPQGTDAMDQSTDGASPQIVISALWASAKLWSADARIVGNIRAEDIARACQCFGELFNACASVWCHLSTTEDPDLRRLVSEADAALTNARSSQRSKGSGE
jgi:hypothetical protein